MESSIGLACLGLAGSLVLLIGGADRFTRCAEKIGTALKLPGFVLGVVIISMGTSLPELVAAIFAVTKGAPTIVAGTVVGSNVTNTFLVLGIAFLFIKRHRLKVNLMTVDLPFLLAVSMLFVFMCYDRDYNWADGVLSVCGAVLYFYNILVRDEAVLGDDQEEAAAGKAGKKGATIWTWLGLPVGGFMIYLGGEWTVESIQSLAALLHVEQSAIAGTAVGLAGALPEMFVCTRFAAAGKIEVALGNVVGASIFNALFVMGVASFLGPSGHLKISECTMLSGLPMMVAAVLIFVIFSIEGRVSKTEGGIFLMFYVFYVGRTLGFM